MYKTTVQLIPRSHYLLGVVVRGPLQGFIIISPPPVTNKTCGCMLTQVSHVSIISLAPCDKHNFRLFAHPSVTCFLYIPSPLWQTQLPLINSPKCHMFSLYPQPPVTNTTCAHMLTQVSHVSIISLAPCDKHNLLLCAHPSNNKHIYIQTISLSR